MPIHFVKDLCPWPGVSDDGTQHCQRKRLARFDKLEGVDVGLTSGDTRR